MEQFVDSIKWSMIKETKVKMKVQPKTCLLERVFTIVIKIMLRNSRRHPTEAIPLHLTHCI